MRRVMGGVQIQRLVYGQVTFFPVLMGLLSILFCFYLLSSTVSGLPSWFTMRFLALRAMEKRA